MPTIGLHLLTVGMVLSNLATTRFPPSSACSCSPSDLASPCSWRYSPKGARTARQGLGASPGHLGMILSHSGLTGDRGTRRPRGAQQGLHRMRNGLRNGHPEPQSAIHALPSRGDASRRKSTRGSRIPSLLMSRNHTNRDIQTAAGYELCAHCSSQTAQCSRPACGGCSCFRRISPWHLPRSTSSATGRPRRNRPPQVPRLRGPGDADFVGSSGSATAIRPCLLLAPPTRRPPKAPTSNVLCWRGQASRPPQR